MPGGVKRCLVGGGVWYPVCGVVIAVDRVGGRELMAGLEDRGCAGGAGFLCGWGWLGCLSSGFFVLCGRKWVGGIRCGCPVCDVLL